MYLHIGRCPVLEVLIVSIESFHIFVFCQFAVNSIKRLNIVKYVKINCTRLVTLFGEVY